MNGKLKSVFLFASVLGILLVTVGVGWFVGTAAAQSAPDCSTVSYDGDGTTSNPYEVGDVDQLQCIEDQGLDANYVQVSDIDASETEAWNGGDGFEPIGSEMTFTGTFDGQGHEITGLMINRSSENVVGLFGIVGISGEVTNVSLIDVNTNGLYFVGSLAGSNLGTVSESHATGSVNGSNQVGGLIGSTGGFTGGTGGPSSEKGTIANSYATGSVSGFKKVGGLVGGNLGTVSESHATGSVNGSEEVGGLAGDTSIGTISNSYATGPVSGFSEVGGLVGRNEDTVNESYATGSVNGSNQVGGLVGVNGFEATILRSHATGSVSGFSEVGGLVGYDVARSEVLRSYATGSIDGSEKVGGLVGNNFGGTIANSYATGSVDGSNQVGGLVGRNRLGIVYSYATGSVNGSSEVGGLVGFNLNSSTVLRAYWDTQTTGQSSSDGNAGSATEATGLTTSEMTGSAASGNMTGFNFTSTWKTVPNEYPVLAWQDGSRSASRNGNDSSMNDGRNDPPSGDGAGTEGLPGFTVVTALLALLTVVAAAIREEGLI